MPAEEHIAEKLCRSCRAVLVEVIEVLDDPAEPYKLCRDCYHRLKAHSLRPREWYNLSAIHGRANDFLGEEYYRETDGMALVPADVVTDSDLFPCPAFESVMGSPDDLLTYILTRNHFHEAGPVTKWFVEDHLLGALRQQSVANLLRVFGERLAVLRSLEQTQTVLRLIGLTLDSNGAELVRDNWERLAPTRVFSAIAFAASRCLPPEEAYQRVARTLAGMNTNERAAAKHVLHCFQTPLNLDWIEENICSPVDSSWGLLAASSGFDWERARKWLALGRPLSLVALDALEWCSSGRKPALIHPPAAQELAAELHAYLGRDNVPRVRESVDRLLPKPARQGDTSSGARKRHV